MGKRQGITSYHNRRQPLHDYFFKVCCLMPIFTVLTDSGWINRIIFSILSVLLISLLLLYGIKKKLFVHLCIMLILFIQTLLQTELPILNINLLFYYPFFVIYVLYIIDNEIIVLEWFRVNRRFIQLVVIAWTIIVGISAFLPSSYYYKEGGARYFGSFSGSIFRLGPTALFIQILIIASMIIYKKKSFILFMILPMYCFFMGSSRTYLIIGMCLFVVAWYIYGVNKKVFYATIIPLLLLALAFTIRSSIMDKITYTFDDTQFGDIGFRLTSGRNVIWAMDIQAWRKQTLLCKLFGSGIDFTLKRVGLWAHNDFIEILCSFGIIGVLQYLIIIKALLYDKKLGNKTIPVIVKGCVFFTWFFNAFFNMHYVYFCCVLSYPFVVIALRYYFNTLTETINNCS